MLFSVMTYWHLYRMCFVVDFHNSCENTIGISIARFLQMWEQKSSQALLNLMSMKRHQRHSCNHFSIEVVVGKVCDGVSACLSIYI